MKRVSIPFFMCALSASCGYGPDHEIQEYRTAIARDLLDPSSAEFRDERVRVLWTAEGSRLKLYCAEVNSNNAIGGKTGFLPVEYVISYRAVKGDGKPFITAGKAYISAGENGAFYLRCQRPDTQRKNRTLFQLYFLVGSFDEQKKEMDEYVPVISNLVAPELR